MIELVAHYLQYRRVGFGRLAALRFAILVRSATRHGARLSAG